MAVAEYLEETRPDSKKLLPEDPLARFKVRRLCEVINAGTQPIQNLGVLKRIEAIGGDKLAWAKETNQKGLETFETLLKETAGKYCVGDEVTLADAFLIPQLYNAMRFGLEEATEFPTIHKVAEALRQLPEFEKAHCDNQSDAVAS